MKFKFSLEEYAQIFTTNSYLYFDNVSSMKVQLLQSLFKYEIINYEYL